MENENENFDPLKKLLSLKQHELPPPGYFNKLPGEVVSRIRAQRNANNYDAMSKLNAEAPWLVRFWQSLEGKPIFAGAFGAAICSVVLAAIFFAEKPATRPTFAGPGNAGAPPIVAATPTGTGGAFDQPVLMAATNQAGQSLFDLIPNGQTAPVNFTP